MSHRRLIDLRRELLGARGPLAVFLVCATVAALLEGLTYPLLYLALAGLGGSARPHGMLGSFAANVLPSGSAGVAATLGAIVVVQILRVASQIVAHSRSVAIGRSLETTARRRVLARIFETPFSQLDALKTSVLSEMTIYLPRDAASWVQSTLQQVVAGLMLAVYLGLMLVIAPAYTLAAIVIFGLALVFVRMFLARTKGATKALYGIQSKNNGRMSETFALLRLIFSSGEERKVGEALSGLGSDMAEVSSRRTSVTASIEPIVEAALVVALGAFVMVIALFHHETDHDTLTRLVLFIAIFQRSASKLRGLASRSSQTAQALTGVARLGELVEGLGAPIRSGGDPPPLVERGLRIEGLTVRHRTDGRPALDDVSFEIPAGKLTALVGPTGSGKSTLLDALQGLVEPVRGRILVDGHSLGELDSVAWRQSIGVVGQDSLLFDMSLEENLRFGVSSRIEKTLTEENAALLRFVDDLPDGLATRAGERGSKLSGGQRQRIAIARALLRDPRVILLDEPTSALDAESEKAVVAALHDATPRRTVVVSAHRLSTILHADRIVVLHEGRCIEQGTHETLLAANGLYARLYRLQSFEEKATDSAQKLETAV